MHFFHEKVKNKSFCLIWKELPKKRERERERDRKETFIMKYLEEEQYTILLYFLRYEIYWKKKEKYLKHIGRNICVYI
jgi:hypothetical protein